MPTPPLHGLDLALAWRRTKLDHDGRVFVHHARECDWVEEDLDGWLNDLASDFAAGFDAQDAPICEVPKPGGSARIGRILSLRDEVAYNALVGAAYPAIYATLRPYQGEPDVAYPLAAPGVPAWTRRGVGVWSQWRQRSIQKLDAGATWMVDADIAGFYNNIDLRVLASDLRAMGVPEDVCQVLIKSLKRWSGPNGRGIPQGYTASDILAKVYLHAIDVALQRAGFDSLRYVDDFRIFSPSRQDARRALLLLTEKLEERTLTLQSSKTLVQSADRARVGIEGVTQTIQAVQRRLAQDTLLAYGEEASYATATALRRLAERHPDSPPPEVLEQTFRESFTAGGGGFDKTLLHYLLTRLGTTRSRVAVPYCLALLLDRPEETEAVLQYFGDIGVTDEDRNAILSYMESRDVIYDYQLYLLVAWFVRHGDFPARLVALCRQWIADQNRTPWLRSYAMLVLGEAGDAADLESIQSRYAVARSDVERAEIVGAMRRMEPSRRNAFYARISGDADIIARAIRVARQG